jgi:hypothetical protein
MMKGILRRPVVWQLCLLFVAVSLLRCSIERSVPYYAAFVSCADTISVLHMEAYGKLSDSHPRPYVYHHRGISGGAVLMYGAEHTRNPENEQVEDIRRRWNEFQPTVALVEGKLGFLMRPFMNPVKTYGESGWVAHLARREEVTVFSWEPLTDSVNRALLSRYTPEQLALSRILNPYFSNLRYGRPDSPEAYVEDVLDRAAEFGVQEKFRSASDVDRYWRLYFPNGPDWRDVSDQWGLPGYLGDISDTRNWIRNTHLTCIILDLVNRGQRVFVVAGSSHAVCVEPALRKKLQ